MKKRNLDITEQTINCVGDLEVDLDKGFIEAAYELWFDVDRYFGTDTRDKDDTWINFYTRWHPDRTITAIYFVESDETVKENTWELTPKEQEFFRKKMEAYAKTQGNQTLQEIWEETKDYIELPTTKNPNKKVYQQDTEKIEDKIDSQGYITGIVYVPLEEVINSSRDRFLELLSIGLTDTTRLRYISYEIVSAETTKSEIGFRVKGDASAIIGTVKGDGIIQDCSLVKKKLVGKKYHLTKIDHETHNYIGTVEGKKGEFSFFPEVLEYSL